MFDAMYKLIVGQAALLLLCWAFALLVAGLLVWWEKTTKGALWRYRDK